jgi:SAM-dependent methyltransferase
VLDLTEAYCRAGEVLTRLTGLSDQVTFQRGDALALPFDATRFDVVWSQHSSMNVGDKPRLFREMHRVLRPGGTLALHEVMAGPGGPLHLPVPWAREPAQSVLRPPSEIREVLGEVGFREVLWEDVSQASLDWFRARVGAVTRPTPPPLSLHLLLGDEFGRMFANQVRNLEEARITVIQAVCEKR